MKDTPSTKRSAGRQATEELADPSGDVFRPRRQTRALLIGCLGVLFIAVVLGVAFGATSIPLSTVLRVFLARLWPSLAPMDILPAHETIIFDLRLPRVALMAVTGAALASAGAAYQGLFRNPLADPYIVGVASGAGFGATLVITLGAPVGILGLLTVPIGAFVGGVVAVLLVIAVAQVGRTMPVTTMLLAGIAVGSFCTAITTFWMLRSPEGLRRAFNWLFGGYSGGGWTPVVIVIPYLAVGLAGVQLSARALNVLQFSDDEAKQLGVNVERIKLSILGSATLMTAAAVAFGGLLAFVGLVVPHVLRILGGPDYRRLLPLSAIGGAAFLILADLIARTLFAPQEFPVGVITALLGAPFFVFLLRRLKRSVF